MTLKELVDFLYENTENCVFGGSTAEEIKETTEALSSVINVPVGDYFQNHYGEYPYIWVMSGTATDSIEGCKRLNREAGKSIDRNEVLALVQEPVSIDSMSIL